MIGSFQHRITVFKKNLSTAISDAKKPVAVAHPFPETFYAPVAEGVLAPLGAVYIIKSPNLRQYVNTEIIVQRINIYNTEIALLRVKRDMSYCKNHAMLFVALDVLVAFDTTDHVNLMTLMQDKYGVRETAVVWFQTYLTSGNREATHRLHWGSQTALHAEAK